MVRSILLAAAASALLSAGCSQPQPAPAPAPIPKVPTADVATTAAPAMSDAPAQAAASSPQALAVNAATFTADASTPEARRNMLLRLEVLLDRAHASPGVIDGAAGSNLRRAVLAYRAQNGLPEGGDVDQALFDRLAGADAAPVLVDYVITQEDVQGPFTPSLPKDMAAEAKLDHLGYSGPLELLAEKFHMDERLLQALNPGVDFSAAGTHIAVAGVNDAKLDAPVDRIEVDKGRNQVTAFDAAGKVLAVYPATVGSTERPAPSGTWAVRVVAPNPTYVFDPSRLTFGDRTKGKLKLAAGPNNPVGSTWIDLTKDTYGIHGTPDPQQVGKTASHGCVRLTNWDARQLGASVRKGATVVFVGAAVRRGRKT